jgi:universal stress protein E
MAYPIRRILVAIKDPRAATFPAAEKAAHLARRLGATLCLFHAIESPMHTQGVTSEGAMPQQPESVKTASARLVARLAKSLCVGGLEVTTATEWDFPPQDAVIRAALRFQADLVVVECHRATHPFPWFPHFPDWDLVRSCPFPVLLVKGAKSHGGDPVLAAVDPTHRHAKRQDLDEEILRYGAGLATALGAALHAVHACSGGAGKCAPARKDACTQRTAPTTAQIALDPLLRHLGIPAEHQHFIDGSPPQVISRVTREVHARILVLGAMARSGTNGVLIGSTAERVLEDLNCDVLVVKPPRFGRPYSMTPRGRQIVASPAPAAAISAPSGPPPRRT